MNLEPGPQLDAAVAKALWGDTKPIYVRDGVCWIGYNYKVGKGGVTGGEREFNPSTDANSALEAALESCLFLDGVHLTRCEPSPSDDYKPFWAVKRLKYTEHGWCILDVAAGQTAAHAICLAILAVKEKP